LVSRQDNPKGGAEELNGSKALNLLSVVAVAAILGSMVALVYAFDSGEESRCPRNSLMELLRAEVHASESTHGLPTPRSTKSR